MTGVRWTRLTLATTYVPADHLHRINATCTDEKTRQITMTLLVADGPEHERNFAIVATTSATEFMFLGEGPLYCSWMTRAHRLIPPANRSAAVRMGAPPRVRLSWCPLHNSKRYIEQQRSR